MPNNAPSGPDVQQNILTSLQAELSDLQPTLSNLTAIAGLLADLNNLASLVAVDVNIQGSVSKVGTAVQNILTPPANQVSSMSEFGTVLQSLYAVQTQLQVWVTQQPTLTEGDQNAILALMASTITQVRALLDYRPDVGAVMDDLAAIKTLMGGPADATAYHDLNVLQMATRDVWIHLFDADLKNAAGQLYDHANQLYAEAGQVMPDPGEITDINQLNDFINGLASVTGVVVPSSSSIAMGNGSFTAPSVVVAPPTTTGQSSAFSAQVPGVVTQYFPDAGPVWSLLSNAQQSSIIQYAQIALDNLRLTESYILDFLDKDLQSAKEPLLSNESNNPDVLV